MWPCDATGRDVFDRYNICDEQDDRHVAVLLSRRLDMAVATAGGESKSTMARTRPESALRLVKGRS